MPTIRLYNATKAKVDIDAVIYAATYNGGFGARLKTPRELAAKQRIVYDEFNASMEEAKGIIEATDDRHRAVAIRIAGEQDIARFLVRSLLSQGCELRLDEECSDNSFITNPEVMFQSMFDMDIEEFTVRRPGYNEYSWLRLVYGNSPPELIADHTVNLDKFLVPTWKYIRSYYDPQFVVEETP